jgi:acetyl/propionyl-CoA carboxylase alpha subunit
MQLKLAFAEHETTLEVDRLRPDLALRINGQPVRLAFAESADPRRVSLVIDGAAHAGWAYRTASEVFVRMDGVTTVFALPGLQEALAAAHQDEVHADMPGLVVSIDCAPGQMVRAGDTLMVIESMKLQSTVTAPRDGEIAAVPFAVNASFDRGAVLVAFASKREDSQP